MEKKKRYWLRGGGVGFIAGLIITVYLYSRDRCILDVADISGLSGVCPSGIQIFLDNLKSFPLYYPVLTVLIFIILGSFVGWLYGKIKNRKSNSSLIANR